MDTDADAELQYQSIIADDELPYQRTIADDEYERKWIARLRAIHPDWNVWVWKDVPQAELARSGMSLEIDHDLDALAYENETNTYHLLKFKIWTGVATMEPAIFGTFLGVMVVMKHLRTEDGKEDRPSGFDATSKVRGTIGTSIPFSQGTQGFIKTFDIESQVLAPEEFVVLPSTPKDV
jgi:hypothetical protein